jgi:hypothetical protein
VVASPATAASLVDGVGGDEALVDGVVEHHGEHGDDAVHGRGGIAFTQVLAPGGDVQGGDVPEGSVAPAGEDVVAQVGAVVLLSAGPHVQGLHPHS